MRASLALIGGAAALVGVGLIARPGERAPTAGDGIVVVRGGPTAGAEPPVTRVAAGFQARGSRGAPAAASVADAADEGSRDPGIWATPAEFDLPEPPG